MIRILGCIALLALAVSQSAQAQAQADHVWAVSELRAHPGQETAYGRAIEQFERPIFEELVRTGSVVSYTMLLKRAGAMENGTHLLIVEYASWEDYINSEQVLDDVTRRLFGRPRSELAAAEYFPRRDVISREIYLALPAGM